MARPQWPAGIKNAGWRFRFLVYGAIVGGLILIAAVELSSSARLIPRELADAGLVLGGALVGLVALYLDETFRVRPERARVEAEREAERQRHQEERRLDFEQYRALQFELRATRARAAALQAKLDLTGALDRERVGDALLLGFYFHRRAERLASSPHRSVFQMAALRLKIVADPAAEVKLAKEALRDVIEVTYGPIVAEGFDLGYLLSHIGEDGLSQARPEVLNELEKQLRSLKFDSHSNSAAGLPAEASELFKKLAARVMSIVRK